MWLAGIYVADDQVVELVARLRAAEITTTADHLERTLDRKAGVLKECPDELLELRATLRLPARPRIAPPPVGKAAGWVDRGLVTLEHSGVGVRKTEGEDGTESDGGR